MTREQAVAAIDVGSTKVSTLIGELGLHGHVNIVGVGVSPSRGMRRGIVSSMEETVESVRASVEKAERSSGLRVESAFVSLSGVHISSVNNRGAVSVAQADRIISLDDIDRASESARLVNIPPNREIIHVIPRSYVVDGQEGVRNPVGMHGYRLDVEVHIISAAATMVQNLARCVQQAGVEVEDLVVQPIASSESVLTEEEKEMGVVIADIGGGTTDVAVFLEGSVWHTAVLPLGGYHVTKDLAIGLRTPFAEAEQIKVKYGRAAGEGDNLSAEIDVVGFGGLGHRPFSLSDLSEILEARMVQILEKIREEVNRSGYDGLLPAGVVLCGGSANLPGIERLAASVLQIPTRVGIPVGLQGLVDTVTDPAYAASVGLLNWGLRHGAASSRLALIHPLRGAWLAVSVVGLEPYYLSR